MSETNQYGLPRYIPEKVRREVRRRDGFGCVFCATPIIDYEHVDPLYVDAHEHLAAAITLLCPTCHRKVTSRQISKDLVKEAMKNPAAKMAGVVRDQVYFCDTHPTVIIGGQKLIRCKIPIHISGHDVFKIEHEDGKYLLSAKFWDSEGKQTLSIVKNEWIVSSDNVWDFKVEGNKFHIKEKEKKTAMTIRFENNQELIIEHFDMLINNTRVHGNDKVLNVGWIKMSGGTVSDSLYGMMFNI